MAWKCTGTGGCYFGGIDCGDNQDEYLKSVVIRLDHPEIISGSFLDPTHHHKNAYEFTGNFHSDHELKQCDRCSKCEVKTEVIKSGRTLLN